MDDPLNAALQIIAQGLPSFGDAHYRDWIAATMPGVREEAALRRSLAGAAALPALDVLIADGDGHRLITTLVSLSHQLWPRFTILIGCANERAPELRRIVDEIARGFGDAPTIRLVPVAAAADDVAALERAALGAARGDHVAFLAAGDQVPAWATAELALALDRLPETVLLYTDEDWIDAEGRRTRPRFKPDWDPDAQLGFDLVGRFSPMQRDVVLAAGGLRAEDGLAAHYALHCRVAGIAGPGRIVHLAAVLRHAARQEDALPELAAAYAAAARTVAVAAAWDWEGVRVTATPAPLAPWLNRIAWPVPDPAPLVSIMIPTRDRHELLEVSARGVLEQTDWPRIELLILDNGSTDPDTLALFRRLELDSRVRVLPMPGPFNFSKLNNDGAAAARGEILVLLNNDIEMIGSNWLREMVSLAVRPEIGCVGAKLFYADRRIQHAGVSMGPHTGCAHVGRVSAPDDPGIDGGLAITRSHSAVTAACLAIRADVYAEVGGLDEAAFEIGYNDVDLCLQVRDHGYRSVSSAFATLFHLESVSRGPNDNPEKHARERREGARIKARWREIFLDDPYQNPNTLLTWDGECRLVAPRRSREWGTMS